MSGGEIIAALENRTLILDKNITFNMTEYFGRSRLKKEKYIYKHLSKFPLKTNLTRFKEKTETFS